jgi:hypothetical protein
MAIEQETNPAGPGAPADVEMPAPTAWPVILAFGMALLFAGLLTSAAVSALGAILIVAGSVGWFYQVLPLEQHEIIPVMAKAEPIITVRQKVARMEVAMEMHRARLPIEVYPISAGVKGGLVGSVAMAVMAMLYGVVSHSSMWYPINLLASVVYAQPFGLSLRHLTSFHLNLLLVATALHLVTSVLVGLLYGVMLPMFPRQPILLGGFIAPLMWSGLLRTSLGIINPLLNQRIDWTWFVASQIAFGIAAGLLVVRQSRVRTRQYMPFAVLAGIEAPGIMDEKTGRSDKQ